MLGVGAVEDNTHILETLGLVDLINLHDGMLVEQAGTNHEESTIHIFLKNLRIHHNIYRRTVDEYIIVIFLCFLEELGYTIIVEKFGGVRRTMTDRHHIHTLMLRHLLYKLLPIVSAPGEIFRQSFRGHPHKLRSRTVAKVAVNYKHFLPFERKRGGKVEGDE